MLYICLDKEHKEVIHLKTKIAVLGSCISRDLFNSNFVPNYKDFFDLGKSLLPLRIDRDILNDLRLNSRRNQELSMNIIYLN